MREPCDHIWVFIQHVRYRWTGWIAGWVGDGGEREYWVHECATCRMRRTTEVP